MSNDNHNNNENREDKLQRVLDEVSERHFNKEYKTRETARIERITTLLITIWNKSPDVRFNQLVDNLQCQFKKENGVYTDMFYVEDDKWEEFLLKEYMKMEEKDNKGE